VGCDRDILRSSVKKATIFRIGNAAEAALWWAMAVVLLVLAARRRVPLRGSELIAALVLLGFGASDIREISSGAWWRPWWLAAWKVASVAVLLLLLLRAILWQRRHRGGKTTGP